MFVEVLGPDHEDVGSALNLLAVVVGEQGDYLTVRFLSVLSFDTGLISHVQMLTLFY